MADTLCLDPIGYFSKDPGSSELVEKIAPPIFKGPRFDSLILSPNFRQDGDEFSLENRDDNPTVSGSGSSVGQSIFTDRDALDLAAIQAVYNIFEPKMTRYADIVGGPGSWTQYLQWKFPSCQGFGISPKTHDWKVVAYGIDTRRFLITYGIDETGDIYNKTNRDEFAKDILRSEYGDYGFQPDLEASEKLIDLCLCSAPEGTLKTFFAQIVTSLRCLGDGGNLVIKIFHLESDIFRQTIFVLSTLFERLVIYKPITSNNQKYLLGFHLIPEVGKPAFRFFEDIFENILKGRWPEQIVTQHDGYEKCKSWIEFVDSRMSENIEVQGGDLYEIYRLLGVPTVDKTICIRSYGKETNLGTVSSNSDQQTVPLIPMISRLTIDTSGVAEIFEDHNWPQNCDPIPSSSFDVSDPTIVDKIVEVFRSIELKFPYVNNYRKFEDFKKEFLNLRVWTQPLEVLADSPIEGNGKSTDLSVFSPLGDDDRYLSVDTREAPDTHTIVNYFSDESRMTCNTGKIGGTPPQLWNEYDNFVRDVVSSSLENETLSLETLRDALDERSQKIVCPVVGPAIFKSILSFLRIKEGRRVFDANFGWGEKLLATAALKANYLGLGDNSSLEWGQNLVNGIRAINKKLQIEIWNYELPLANPENITIKFDVVFYTPRVRSDNLVTEIYPTINQLWSLVRENGHLIVLSSDIGDILPYAFLGLNDIYFNGPIFGTSQGCDRFQNLGRDRFQNRGDFSAWIFQKIAPVGGMEGLTKSQERRNRKLLTTSKKYFEDNFGFSGPFDSQLLVNLDDFPYYTKYEGLKSASKMFATLRKTRANVENVTLSTAGHIKGLLNNISKYIDISDGRQEVSYLFSRLLNENLTRDQRFEILTRELADFPRLPPVDVDKRAASRIKEIQRLIKGESTSILDIGGDDGSILRALGASLNVSAERRYLIDPAGKESEDYRLITYTPEGNIPLPDASIDVIILLNSLHHIPNRPQLIREIGRVLSLDGVIVVREHNDENYDKMFEKFIDILHESISAVGTSHNDSECYLFSRASLQRWMANVGLGSQTYIDVGGPQALYYESYARNPEPKVLDHKSRLSNGSSIVVRIWPDDYMKSDFCSNWFTEPQRMTCSKGGLPSPMDYWHSLSLKERKKILAQGIPKANDALYSMICTNFNPVLYRELILRSIDDAGVVDVRRLRVLDPSSGWGDRLIGALSLGVSIYLGVDPNPTLESAYKRIIQTFSRGKDLSKKYQVLREYFEKYDNPNFNNYFDIAMTSPPYFTFEVYPGAEAPKSGMYQEWLDVMYRPYLHQAYRYVKTGGVLIFYVDDVPGGEFRQSTIDILDELAEYHLLERLPTIGLRTDTNTGRKITPGPGIRTALRWRKIKDVDLKMTVF